MRLSKQAKGTQAYICIKQCNVDQLADIVPSVEKRSKCFSTKQYLRAIVMHFKFTMSHFKRRPPNPDTLSSCTNLPLPKTVHPGDSKLPDHNSPRRQILLHASQSSPHKDCGGAAEWGDSSEINYQWNHMAKVFTQRLQFTALTGEPSDLVHRRHPSFVPLNSAIPILLLSLNRSLLSSPLQTFGFLLPLCLSP